MIRKCVICRKVNGTPYPKPDSPLSPKMHLLEAPPFIVTGIDFTGVMNVEDEHVSIRNAYICLFTCASTKEVIVEVSSDLSEDSFIKGFRRLQVINQHRVR